VLKSLFLVKFVHTLIFVFMAACIGVVVHGAVSGQITTLTWASFVMVMIEAIVFVGNGWRCPLTDYAESLGAENGSVADIFLPIWAAKRLPVVASTVFGTASIVMIVRAVA
jgi:hypothetical protein